MRRRAARCSRGQPRGAASGLARRRGLRLPQSARSSRGDPSRVWSRAGPRGPVQFWRCTPEAGARAGVTGATTWRPLRPEDADRKVVCTVCRLRPRGQGPCRRPWRPASVSGRRASRAFPGAPPLRPPPPPRGPHAGPLPAPRGACGCPFSSSHQGPHAGPPTPAPLPALQGGMCSLPGPSGDPQLRPQTANA